MNESIALEGAPGISASASRQASRVHLPFEFRGNGGEYFRIWIVNLLLTIVTFGIYSAWAKVRRLRYFYGNTYLDGHPFEFHGRPIAILKGRLIVFVAYLAFAFSAQLNPVIAFILVPVAIFGVPWIIMKSRLFQTRMTSYRNIRFNFHGTYGGALGAFVGWYLLAAISFGILYPAWVKKRVEYSLDNASYGTQKWSFLTSTGRFYTFCLITAGLSIAAMVVFSGLFLSLAKGMNAAGSYGAGTELAMLASMGIGVWLTILVAAAVALAIGGYYQASFLNASFGGVQVGGNYLRSNLEIAPLVWIYVTNLLGIVFTLGLFYPWAKVRQTRYQLENMAMDSDGNLSAF
ncbi:MAG TPA: YjgN family protein, partial [Steroidobacteraceae bacterium]